MDAAQPQPPGGARLTGAGGTERAHLTQGRRRAGLYQRPAQILWAQLERLLDPVTCDPSDLLDMPGG